MKISIVHHFAVPLTLLAVGAFSPDVHADWGSLHGNNRSAAPAQSAGPRQQPQQQIRAVQPVARPEAPRQEMQPDRAQSRSVEPVRQPAAVFERSPAKESDSRRLDIGEDRRQSYFWSDYHRGMRVDRLPDGYRRFRIHDHDFFYYGGVYYDGGASGYVVVDPPLDADIPELPPGAETLQVGNSIYYYVDGAFYVQQSDSSYVIVAAPIGVTVSLLPSDAITVGVNGTTYYQADMTYYLPVMQDGVTAYITVPPPQ